MVRVTYEQALAALMKYKGSYNINPKSGSSCVYTDYYGAHCLVGQVLTDLGVPVPQNNDNAVTSRFRIIVDDGWFRTRGVTFEPEAFNLLNRAQRYADMPRDVYGGYAHWGKVLQRMGLAS